MEFTKADYEERKARIDAGEGSDEDRRLVKMYEQEKPSGGPVSDTAAYDAKAESDKPGKYDGKSPADLKAEAKRRGLQSTGSRDELVTRLEQADADADTAAKGTE